MIRVIQIKRGTMKGYWAAEECDDTTGKFIRTISAEKTRANIMMIVRAENPELVEQVQKAVQKSLKECG